MAKYSDAQKRAVAKYNAKTYDEIKVRVAKGKKEAIQMIARQNGESVNAYINKAIDERLNKDE